MKKYDFTVIGTAATVSVLKVGDMPVPGRSTPVFNDGFMEYSNGGMGLNICAGLAMLGASVRPVLTYADARQHDFLHSFAARFGMPEDGIKDPPDDASGTTIMIQDRHKCHMTLITGYRRRQPDSDYYGRQVYEPRFFSESGMTVFTIPMAMNTSAAIDAVLASGVPLAFSMRKDPAALPPEQLRRLLRGSEFLFANEAEAAYIKEEFGLGDIRDLFGRGKLRHIAVTMGASGSAVYSAGPDGIAAIRVPAVPPSAAELETIGAGDGYVCGFLYGYTHGRSISDCALLGGAVSSFVLEKEGSITNLPDEEQLLERFENFKSKGRE